MATQLSPSPMDILRFVRQPIRRLNDGGLWGEELLARPLGLDSPSEREAWFARCDDDGMLDRIDAEAVGVASGLMRIPDDDRAGAGVLINCSFRSTHSVRWRDAIEVCATTNSASRRPLTVEFTEQAEPRDMDAASATTRYLQQLGFGVALDDVGSPTGKHVISMFETLKPNVVKLSRELVNTAMTGTRQQSSRAEAELRGYVSHAKSLGISVVIEGVEGPQHYAFAAHLGVDAVQGYWIDIPC